MKSKAQGQAVTRNIATHRPRTKAAWDAERAAWHEMRRREREAGENAARDAYRQKEAEARQGAATPAERRAANEAWLQRDPRAARALSGKIATRQIR
ncbi:MAG: hypothetical protein ACYC26_13990 [Phycisphaerales bacterium]